MKETIAQAAIDAQDNNFTGCIILLFDERGHHSIRVSLPHSGHLPGAHIALSSVQAALVKAYDETP